MKCIYTDGCTATSLTVDGKETVKMTAEELRGILKKMLDKVQDFATLQSIWMHIMECIGEYKDLGKCSQCGDWIYQYTLEL